MAKRQIEAGKAVVELGIRDRIDKGLKGAQKKFTGWGKSVTRIGAVGAGAAAAVLGPLTAMTKNFASAGDKLHKMAARTDVAASSLDQLKFAANASGTSIDAVGSTIQKMNRRMGRIFAGAGSKSQIEALEKLGVSIEELEKMNPEQRFLAMADAIAGYGDQAEAAGLAQRVMGAGVDKLLPLFANGSEGIRQMMEEGKRFGTVTDEDAESAAALTDALGQISAAMVGIKNRIGAALAPSLTWLASAISEGTVVVSDWINEHRAMIPVIAGTAAAVGVASTAVMGFGGVLIAGGAIVGGITTVIGGLGSVLAFLATPAGIAVGAIAGLIAISGGAVYAILQFTDAGQVAKAGIMDAFGTATQNILGDFANAWEGIKDSIAAGDIAGAIRQAFTFAKLALVRGGKGLLLSLSEMNRAIAENMPFFMKPQAFLMNKQADALEGVAGGLDKQIQKLEIMAKAEQNLAAGKRATVEAEREAEQARKDARAESLREAIAAQEERLEGATAEKADDIRDWIGTLKDELAKVEGSSGGDWLKDVAGLAGGGGDESEGVRAAIEKAMAEAGGQSSAPQAIQDAMAGAPGVTEGQPAGIQAAIEQAMSQVDFGSVEIPKMPDMQTAFDPGKIGDDLARQVEAAARQRERQEEDFGQRRESMRERTEQVTGGGPEGLRPDQTGTFSAAAASIIGSGQQSFQRRMAEGIDAVAENTKTIAKQAKKGGVARFGA